LALAAELHARFLEGAAAILDLMSAVPPPLPQGAGHTAVTVLRGPEQEQPGAAGREQLLIRNLAEDPRLPLPDRSMDACVCCLGADALPRPQEILAEVGRVLKPGAPLVLTFTDPPTAAAGVTRRADLYPFERLGLLLHAVAQDVRFTRLETETVRGYPLTALPAAPIPRTGALFAVLAQATGGTASS